MDEGRNGAKPGGQSTEENWKPSGSGIYLKETTHILTNLHVVRNATKIRISIPSGERYSGEVVARDANNDVAIIALWGVSKKRR
ncbi:MAG: serine protease, partial [Nitrospinota bacterium]